MPESFTDYQREVWSAGLELMAGGAKAVLIKRTFTPNRLSGGVVATNTRHSLTMARFSYKQRDFFGETVQVGDQKFYISSKEAVEAGVTPSIDDLIQEGDNRTWKIITLKVMQPNMNDDPIGYVAQCRQEGPNP